jgi:uncharacterized membrane-anchored protein YhcB (DUF1043 family)
MEAYMSTYINAPSYVDTNTLTITPLDIGIGIGTMIIGIVVGTIIVKSSNNDCLQLEDLTNKRNKYREDWDNYLKNRNK